MCERTPQVRDALVAAVAGASDCSEVDDDDGIDELAGITGALSLFGQGIAALKPGDFAGLSGVTILQLNGNALNALPAGVFDGLGAVRSLDLYNNALGAGSLEDGVFEPLTGVFQLNLSNNPGSASFVPKADAGEDLVLRAGETATLGGPGTGGGPWGMNVEYEWVEVDADDTPVAERTEGLSATGVARPAFTAPALTEERVLRYRLAVQGRGYGNTDAHTASDTVTVTVRAAPAVTAVAVTSVPQNPTFQTYRAGERIEVSVTFSAPVTVTGPPVMKPTIGLEVGTVTRYAAYLTKSAPHVLVFGYTVTDDDTDADGVAVPANGILLGGGTIADAQGGAAGLGHDAVAADAAHQVDGSDMVRIGGVCGRTLQVRDALVAHAIAKNAMVTHCSEVGVVVGLDELDGALNLSGQGIAALKADDFAGLGNVTGLNLSDNALTALPAGVFEPLTGLLTLALSGNTGSASFLPTADSGANLVLRAGESATLGGPGTGGGPWGTNVDYAWIEVDAEGNPVADAARTEGLSATDEASPNFTAPALAAERVVRYRFTVTGKGAATEGELNRHRASDTVTVTVRAAPAVTAVALTSAPRADATYREGRDDRGERDLLDAGDGDRAAGDDADDRARGGDAGAAGGVCAQCGAGGAGVRPHGNRRRHGRRRHRGAGERHLARGRDHRRRPGRGCGARPRCGGGGRGAQGRRAWSRRRRAGCASARRRCARRWWRRRRRTTRTWMTAPTWTRRHSPGSRVR